MNLARGIYCLQTMTNVDLVNTRICFLPEEKWRNITYSRSFLRKSGSNFKPKRHTTGRSRNKQLKHKQLLRDRGRNGLSANVYYFFYVVSTTSLSVLHVCFTWANVLNGALRGNRFCAHIKAIWVRYVIYRCLDKFTIKWGCQPRLNPISGVLKLDTSIMRPKWL